MQTQELIPFPGRAAASPDVDAQIEEPSTLDGRVEEELPSNAQTHQPADAACSCDHSPQGACETEAMRDPAGGTAETGLLEEPAENRLTPEVRSEKDATRELAVDSPMDLAGRVEVPVDPGRQVETTTQVQWTIEKNPDLDGQPGGPSDPNLRPKKKVLIVDDDPTMRMLLKMGLSPQDYDCLTAENGKAAQAVLQSSRPDLILLDLLMPVMDGLAFIQWLRQIAQDPTPVLVFSNVNDPKITQEALRSGANFFACKPLHLRELVEAMKKLVPA